MSRAVKRWGFSFAHVSVLSAVTMPMGCEKRSLTRRWRGEPLFREGHGEHYRFGFHQHKVKPWGVKNAKTYQNHRAHQPLL